MNIENVRISNVGKVIPTQEGLETPNRDCLCMSCGILNRSGYLPDSGYVEAPANRFNYALCPPKVKKPIPVDSPRYVKPRRRVSGSVSGLVKPLARRRVATESSLPLIGKSTTGRPMMFRLDRNHTPIDHEMFIDSFQVVGLSASIDTADIRELPRKDHAAVDAVAQLFND